MTLEWKHFLATPFMMYTHFVIGEENVYFRVVLDRGASDDARFIIEHRVKPSLWVRVQHPDFANRMDAHVYVEEQGHKGLLSIKESDMKRTKGDEGRCTAVIPIQVSQDVIKQVSERVGYPSDVAAVMVEHTIRKVLADASHLQINDNGTMRLLYGNDSMDSSAIPLVLPLVCDKGNNSAQ